MATGEVKISALPLDTAPTADDYVATVDVGTSTTKKVPLGELSQALDKTLLLSTDADNLLTTGTDYKIRLEAAADVISTDAGNILQKGTDGKLLAPSVAASLTKDRMWIGGATNTPEEKTDLQVRSFLGLPTDYKNVSVVRDSGTQVTVQGKCRSEQDDINLELASATPVALLSPSANTSYNLFFAKVNDASPTVAFFDSASVPAGYAHYRIITTIPTDGLSNLANFIYDNNYLEVELWSGSSGIGTVTLNNGLSNYKNVIFTDASTNRNLSTVQQFITSGARIAGSTTSQTRILDIDYLTDTTISVSNADNSTLSNITGIK